jgi:hypothetical protein
MPHWYTPGAFIPLFNPSNFILEIGMIETFNNSMNMSLIVVITGDTSNRLVLHPVGVIHFIHMTQSAM